MLRWRIGTRLGRFVVPLVCSRIAMSSGPGSSSPLAGRAGPAGSKRSSPEGPVTAWITSIPGVAAAKASGTVPGVAISALTPPSS